jgi:hypothetical protein
MRTIQKLALGALLTLSPAALKASDYYGGYAQDDYGDYGQGYRSEYRSEYRRDYRSEHVQDYRSDYRSGGGYTHSPVYTPPCHTPFSSRVEVQAQIRLRQLGYYRGSIDGLIGRGSRYAISRFQYDYRLPPTGYLDQRTLRALGIRR